MRARDRTNGETQCHLETADADGRAVGNVAHGPGPVRACAEHVVRGAEERQGARLRNVYRCARTRGAGGRSACAGFRGRSDRRGLSGARRHPRVHLPYPRLRASCTVRDRPCSWASSSTSGRSGPLKALAARRYRPSHGDPDALATTVLVPVYREPEAVFRRVLASVRANGPNELIAVVDGGDPASARRWQPSTATGCCDIPKAGKRAAIAAGLAASDPATDVVVVVDSDTVWEAGALPEMLRPFADPRVGRRHAAPGDLRRAGAARCAGWPTGSRTCATS